MNILRKGRRITGSTEDLIEVGGCLGLFFVAIT